MNTKVTNIFKNIPKEISEEIFEEIFSNDIIRIERIISKGQSSPTDFWYEQQENEFVILLKGKATISINENKIQLNSGDYINIPAKVKHRVEWTDPNNETIWLAVFY